MFHRFTALALLSLLPFSLFAEGIPSITDMDADRPFDLNPMSTYELTRYSLTGDAYKNSFTDMYRMQADGSGSPADDQGSSPTRRSMLRWHQAFGALTWVSWLATNLAGEQAYRNMYREGDDLRNYVLLTNPGLDLVQLRLNPTSNFVLYNLFYGETEWEGKGGTAHKNLAYTTAGLYAITAGLALLAPPKFSEARREGGFDSVFWHKGLAVLHFISLASMPALGERIEKDGPRAANTMRNVGWLGFTSLTMAAFVFYF